MKRVITVVAVLSMIAGASVAPAAASPKGKTRTMIAGGWEGTPPIVPTGLDPANQTFTAVGHTIWNGSLNGLHLFDMTGSYTTESGDWVATAKGELTGVWLPDGSKGTLTWEENLWGNFVTGAFGGTITITGGSGDPAFQCSSGQLTFAGYTIIPASYGSYSGEWIHGCK